MFSPVVKNAELLGRCVIEGSVSLFYGADEHGGITAHTFQFNANPEMCNIKV